MTLAKEVPFQREKTDEEKAQEKGKIFTIYLNDDEYKSLQYAKQILSQPKDSTALKQLARIGLLYMDEMKPFLDMIFKNRYNNKRTGLVSFND